MAVRIDIDYAEGLLCKAIHEPSGDVLRTDAPKDNQGEGKHFSPTDLLATSLLTCMVTTMAIAARGRQLTLGPVRGQVEKHMGTTPRRHVEKLVVRLTLQAAIPMEARDAMQRAALGCPVASSLAPTCQVDLLIDYV